MTPPPQDDATGTDAQWQLTSNVPFRVIQ